MHDNWLLAIIILSVYLGNYVKRQIDRWSKQYISSRTHDIPAMDHLMSWLPSKAPETDVTTVVHGDYRYV